LLFFLDISIVNIQLSHFPYSIRIPPLSFRACPRSYLSALLQLSSFVRIFQPPLYVILIVLPPLPPFVFLVSLYFYRPPPAHTLFGLSPFLLSFVCPRSLLMCVPCFFKSFCLLELYFSPYFAFFFSSLSVSLGSLFFPQLFPSSCSSLHHPFRVVYCPPFSLLPPHPFFVSLVPLLSPFFFTLVFFLCYRPDITFPFFFPSSIVSQS